MIIRLFFCVLSCLALATSAPAADGIFRIGINFGADEPAGAGSAVGPSVLAGAVPQINWNNLTLASGSASSLVGDWGGTALPTTVSVTWTSPNTWSSTGRGEENNGFAPGGDRDLMTGYLDTTDTAAGKATVTVSGLDPRFTSVGYDVYVYFLGGVGGRGGAYTIGQQTKMGTAMANPGFHVEDPGVDMVDAGTYVRFSGLSDASFTLISDASVPGSNFRAPINGLQIVAVPEPCALGLLVLGSLVLGVGAWRRSG